MIKKIISIKILLMIFPIGKNLSNNRLNNHVGFKHYYDEMDGKKKRIFYRPNPVINNT